MNIRLLGLSILAVAGYAHPYDSIQEMLDAGEFPTGPEIRLTYHRLTSLAGIENVPNPETIVSLDLSWNKITDVPDKVFDALVNVETLNLSNNPLKELRPDVFNKLVKLKRIDLGSTDLQTLPEGILDSNTALEEFTISGESLVALPPGLLRNTPNLTSFIISHVGSKISELDAQFFLPAQKLKTIEVSNSEIKQLYLNQFAGLSLLSEIDFSGNNISSLPENIFASNKALQEVLLSQNPIASQPPKGLRKVIPLKVWTDISLFTPKKKYSVNDLLDSIKADLGDTGLVIVYGEGAGQHLILDLSYQGLTSLEGVEKIPARLIDEARVHGPVPENIPLANDIKTILLNNNYLQNIPEDSLAVFAGLEVLNVANNRLQEVPVKPMGAQENRITELNLSDNLIQELPVGSLDAYTALDKLKLQRNRITRLDNELFDKLINLRKLNLARNKISYIGPRVFALNQKLTDVNLYGNNLVYIPRSLFEGLQDLKRIDISGNMLNADDLKYYKFPAGRFKLEIISGGQRVAPLAILAARKYQEAVLENMGLELLAKK